MHFSILIYVSGSLYKLKTVQKEAILIYC